MFIFKCIIDSLFISKQGLTNFIYIFEKIFKFNLYDIKAKFRMKKFYFIFSFFIFFSLNNKIFLVLFIQPKIIEYSVFLRFLLTNWKRFKTKN